MALADRIAVLQGGRILQYAVPTDIYARPNHFHVARLFGDPTIILLECRIQRDEPG